MPAERSAPERDPDAGASGHPAADGAAIDVLADLVHRRRTSLVIDPETPVPDELIDRLIDLAVWAPNHKRNWPWRFAVFVGEGRRRLGAAMATAGEAAGLPEKKLDKLRVKYLRSPVVLLIASVADEDPLRHAENRDAVAAAVQNILLGATALGLASHWATVDDAVAPAARTLCGLGPSDELVALIYLGWPTGDVPAPQRPAPEVLRVAD